MAATNGLNSWVLPGAVMALLSIYWAHRLYPLYRDLWLKRKARLAGQTLQKSEATPSSQVVRRNARNVVALGLIGLLIIALLVVGLLTESHGNFPLWDQWVLFAAFWSMVVLKGVRFVTNRRRRLSRGGELFR